MVDMADLVRSNRARRWAKRLGLMLRRSRARAVTLDDYGLFQVAIHPTGKVIAGAKFDLSIADVEAFLADFERKLVAERSR